MTLLTTKKSVVSRANLPSQGKVLILGLLYILFSKVYHFPDMLDGAMAVLFGIWTIAELVLFSTQVPVDIFKVKEEESE